MNGPDSNNGGRGDKRPFEASAEHSPMSGIDELLIHNYPHPVRVMWVPDAQAYERIWFTAQDTTGDLLVVVGLAFYPNLGTAEAFAIINCRGKHTTVRAHRRLGDDRTDMRLGPLNFELLAAFQEWRLTLDENEWGISFDIHWHDTTRAIFRNLGVGMIAEGRVFGGIAGYDTFGEQEGWVEVDGERFELTRSTYCGTRDHHWGTRDGVGGPGRWMGFQHASSGAFVDFGDWSVWTDHYLYPLGDDRRGSAHLRRRTHRLRFDPETKMVLGGEVDMIMPGGETKTMTFERMGNQIVFLRCAMYGGPNGGTPDGDLWQGMYVGDNVVTGETYDANDPDVRLQIQGLDQMHMRFECDGEVAYGIFEAYTPLAHDTAAQGRQGLHILDT